MLAVLLLACLALAQGASVQNRASNVFKSHQKLTESDVSGKRVLIVGDVHGCMGELYDLLEEADMLDSAGTGVKDDAILVLAGDFINKGPRNREVVQFIMANDNVYASTGNHEMNILNDPDSEKYPWTEAMNEDEWDFIRNVPWTVSIPDEGVTVVVTHAGLMPDVALEEQEEFVLTRMRNLIPNEESGGWIASDERDDGVAWASVWEGPYHVVFGHDAGRRLQQEEWATGLDTRCVSGELLTGLWLPVHVRDQSFVQVPCKEWDP